MSGTLSGTESVDLSIAPGEFQDLNALTLTNGAALLDDGTLTQDGNFQLGQTSTDTSALTIAAGGAFEMVNDTPIGADGQAVIVNAGLFEKLGIAQYESSLIDPSFTNTSTGTIDAAIGLINLQAGGVLDGTLAGAGEINLGDVASSGTYNYTLDAAAVVSVATLAVEGDGYSGVSGLVLGGGTRTFTNTLLLGEGSALDGGTMVIAGSAVVNDFIIADAGTIIDTGTIIENGAGLQLGNGGTESGNLIIAAGGVFDAVADGGYGITANGSGPSTLLNEGLFINTSTDHVAVIGMNMTNAATGTIAIIAGGIDAADNYPQVNLVNDGLITISNGVLTVGLFYDAVGTIGADPGASGLIEIGNGGTAAFASTVASNQTIDFTGADSLLLINKPARFAAPIENFGAGDTIDLYATIANGFSFNTSTDVLALTDTVGGAVTGVAALTLAGFTDIAALTLLNDGDGGTEIVLEPSGGTFIANGSVTTDTWTVSSGDWGNASNWSAGSPATLNLVSLTSGSSGIISYDTTDTIDALSDGSGGAFTLDQTGGVLTLLDGGTFLGGVTQAPAGMLADDGGILALSGSVSLAGTLAGAGVIELDGYQHLDTLAAGAVLDVASLAIYNGAELVLAGNASFAGDFLDEDNGILDLNGYNLTLSGNSSFENGAANILGAGTIYVTGETNLDINFSNNAVLVDSGTIVQDPPGYGDVEFPSQAGFTNLYIVPGGVYDVVNGSGFQGNIVNAGLLEHSGVHSGTSSNIYGNLTNLSTGIVSLAAGTQLSDSGTSAIAGTITGAGTLAISGTATIDPSSVIAVQNLLFLGNLYLGGNSYTFSQNVQIFYGAIYGNGTLDLTGASVIGGYNLGAALYHGAVLIDSGSMLGEAALGIQGDVTSNNTFYAASELSIASGAVFNIVDAYGISGAGYIVNDGLFQLSAGVGADPIQPYFENASTGTIDVINGTLDFAGGGTFAGTLEGPGAITFGGNVIFAPGIVLDAGAIVFDGTNTTGAPLVAAPGSSLTVATGAVVQSPTIAGGALILASGSTIDGNISLTGTGGTLVIEPNNSGVTSIPANNITGFSAGDTINLAGVSFTSFSGSYGAPGADSYTVATAGTLSIDANGTFYNVLIAGATVGQDNFILSGDLGITEAACFAAGTRILTAGGALVPVEALEVGDEVELFSGAAAPVVWIGRRTLDLRRHPRPHAVQPILIRAGALGANIPWRDLVVSPDHAMYLHGHLIPAKALLNGFSIRQLSRARVTYYHIELATHAVLFAEGAPAESYLETGNRAAFENAGGAMLLHPDFAQSLRESKGCAPFAEAGPAVEAARQRILDRAGIATTDDPALKIRYKNGAAILESRSAIPGEIFADPRDRRRLGVKIAALQIGENFIPFSHPCLIEGWHDPEADGRWTNGRAVIPASLLAGARDVRVSLAATLRYPTAPARAARQRQA
jgi:hypothetical protein